ncbi:MAG: hypothetical protein DRP78_00670 [Candidatus Omnitrophota bacterium]|nr:MAG: hypothetical protein DRP78_00670 [Candidatus Omnitrophota bacterium]
MVTIDLLPAKYKEAKLEREKYFPLTLFLVILICLILFVLFFVYRMKIVSHAELQTLNMQLDGLAPGQRKVFEIQEQIAEAKECNNVFEQLLKRNFLWARKLNKLSDSLICGIWLRALSLDNEKIATDFDCIKIDGTVVSLEHKEMALIGKFIRNLKSDAEFFKNFKNIKLESVIRRNIADVEVMDFTLTCYFKNE